MLIPQSIYELRDGLESGAFSATDVITHFLTIIKEKNPEINAFIDVYHDEALRMAAAVDEARKSGTHVSALAGIPFGIKENMHFKGKPTTCCSNILNGFIAPFDCTAVRQCLDAGLIPLGKLNMDEFAMGSSCEYSAYGPTKNPWDLSVVPGGSSGGSAAAVAAGMVPLALGSDTGGSIRQPASFCGISGFKPSYGTVSRYGLVAFASSLDQIGPMGWSVADIAAGMSVLHAHDPLDSTSENVEKPDYEAALTGSIKGVKVGVPDGLINDHFHPDVVARFEESLDTLKSLGAEIVPVKFEYFDAALSAYYILAPAEASANLERYDGVRFGYRSPDAKNLKEMIIKSRSEGFGDEVKRRIIMGTFVLSSGYYDAYYLQGLKVRSKVIEAFKDVFSSVDVMALPTAPSPAFRLNENSSNPMAMYLSDIATIPVNLAGLPGLSVPAGFSSDGLPVGIQFVGNAFDDTRVLNVGHAFQTVTDFHTKRPGVQEAG
ncbi:MAG: Asp-tRNA(Asn)/Glu-tRNA(Gln) amidotransferase subunit GatA [bacterium]|nr:Asp-tRNA(Asn)/Glu-tRNA(Gln) amidotransferase subunit GatA [bacterium]